MWKDSIRNKNVNFQTNILGIVGFYVRHSASEYWISQIANCDTFEEKNNKIFIMAFGSRKKHVYKLKNLIQLDRVNARLSKNVYLARRFSLQKSKYLKIKFILILQNLQVAEYDMLYNFFIVGNCVVLYFSELLIYYWRISSCSFQVGFWV